VLFLTLAVVTSNANNAEKKTISRPSLHLSTEALEGLIPGIVDEIDKVYEQFGDDNDDNDDDDDG